MKLDLRVLLGAGLCALAVSTAIESRAQQAEYTNNFKYNRGQSIQPIFEGWSRTPDGRIQMHFGYLNRNHVEQPHIPVGPNNRIEPAGPDRGQPTFFYTRTRRNLFTVVMPKEWNKTQELVWTLTHHGRQERAVGWLQAEWEVGPTGNRDTEDPEFKSNQPPSITADSVASIKLPATASLSAAVSDDGLPKPRPPAKPSVGQETPPTLQGGIDAPVNVRLGLTSVGPQQAPGGGGGGAQPGGSQRPDGLTVSWSVWRGPADASFDPRYAQARDGKTQTTATFSAPGEYVLRSAATDGRAMVHTQVTVSVARIEQP